MAKVIVDGKEVAPCKKINLAKSKSMVEINKILMDKIKELKNANTSKDNK